LPQPTHRYPTDLGLLNLARLHTEKIRDILYKHIKGKFRKKPITDRNLAIIYSLVVAKQGRPSRNKRRKAIHKQLQYIKRNLAHIQQLIELGATRGSLNKKQDKTLLVVAQVYRQQQWLFENKKPSIEDRIVSLSQPHICSYVARRSRKKPLPSQTGNPTLYRFG